MFSGPRSPLSPIAFPGESSHGIDPNSLAGIGDVSVVGPIDCFEVSKTHFIEFGRYLATYLTSGKT